MSSSHTPQSGLVSEVEALVAAIMADAPLAEIISIVDQLEAVVDRQGEIPATVVAELRSAIDLMRGGQSSATVSALLAARSELTMPPH